jgi:hypothetical protein
MMIYYDLSNQDSDLTCKYGDRMESFLAPWELVTT